FVVAAYYASLPLICRHGRHRHRPSAHRCARPLLTDAYVIAARAAGHVHPDGMAGWPTWSAEEHLRLMDRWGVATAMLSISSPGTHFGDDASGRRLTREVNEVGAAICRAHPGRFGHF